MGDSIRVGMSHCVRVGASGGIVEQTCQEKDVFRDWFFIRRFCGYGSTVLRFSIDRRMEATIPTISIAAHITRRTGIRQLGPWH